MPFGEEKFSGRSIIVFSLSLYALLPFFLRGDASAGWNIHTGKFWNIFSRFPRKCEKLRITFCSENIRVNVYIWIRQTQETPHILKDDLLTDELFQHPFRDLRNGSVLRSRFLLRSRSISHVKPLTCALRWKIKLEKHFRVRAEVGNRLFIYGICESI